MPGSFAEVTGFHGGGPSAWPPASGRTLPAWPWPWPTDRQRGWDLNDQARRYIAWWKKGEYSVNGRCFHIGDTVYHGLSRFLKSGDARGCGDTSATASSNGRSCGWPRGDPLRPPVSRSSRRVDPVVAGVRPAHPRQPAMPIVVCVPGIAFGRSDPWPSPRRSAGAVLAAAVAAEEICPLESEVDEVSRGSFRELQPPQIVGSGYVVRGLEAALWAFHDAEDFRQAVLRAVNLGDDADTTGAICGQLAGGVLGRVGHSARMAGRAGGAELHGAGVAEVAGRAGSASASAATPIPDPRRSPRHRDRTWERQ